MRSSAAPVLRLSPLPALRGVLEFVRLIGEVDHAVQPTSKRMEATPTAEMPYG